MEFDWNKYRKKIVKRLVVVVIMMILPIIIAASLIPQYQNTFSEVHTINGDIDAQKVGTYCAFILVVFIEIILGYRLSCYIRIESSEVYAEKYYIRTHDERNQYIEHMSSATTMKVSLYVLGVVAAVAGCFDQVVFYTLIAAFFVMILISIATFMYYKHKN
ncbi:MAG: hypothetical protein K6G28_05545 [Acholeplasmatales bacterium]|nr:hypothetical protein [Acholeplasmatales bacterium]